MSNKDANEASNKAIKAGQNAANETSKAIEAVNAANEAGNKVAEAGIENAKEASRKLEQMSKQADKQR